MHTTDPFDDPRIGALVDRWDDLCAQGKSPSASDVTDDPELLPVLQKVLDDIFFMDKGLGNEPAPPAVPAQGAPGRYVLLGWHAAGGMGEVYRALDVEFGREVAYKVSKAPETNGRATARFLSEGRVTARLQHPGVVPAYGFVKDASGRPAYAMRFVEGDPLRVAVSRFHKSLSEVPTSQNVWRPLLNHFVRVCQAIDYAHDAGVLHRDLAPHNIMLVGDDETFVIDWGLATDAPGDGDLKWADATRKGTAAYTAPEVCDPGESRPFGRHSDVYSLGTLLYLILTDRDPYSGDTTDVVKRICAGPPPDAASVLTGIPRPLARICSKAMRRMKEDRYGSAKELAEDVERWLAGDRVLADKEPWTERSWRWASRHRTPVGMAAVLLVAVTIGGAIAYDRERRLRERADAATVRADDERQRTQEVLEEVIAQAESIGALQPSWPKAKAVLDRVARRIQEVARRSEADPDRLGLVVHYLLRAGRIRFKLNQVPEAADLLARATALAERQARDVPADPESRHRWATGLREWGVTQAMLGRVDQAKPAWEKAVTLLEPIASSSPDFMLTLAKTHMVLGNYHMIVNDFKESGIAFERARALAAGLAAAAPGEARYRFALADVYNNQGKSLMDEAAPGAVFVRDPDRLAESLAAHRKALELRRRLVQDEPENPEYMAYLAASFNHLGNVLQLQGDGQFADAEASYREALALLEPLAVAFPGDPSHRREVAQIFSNLNLLFVKQGQWAKAEDLARAAVAHFSRLAKTFPDIHDHSYELGIALEQLANTLRLQGQVAEAGGQDYAAAVAFGRASALLSEPARRDELAEKAVTNLERINREGYFGEPRRLEQFWKEQAFSGVRERPDFIKRLGGFLRK